MRSFKKVNPVHTKDDQTPATPPPPPIPPATAIVNLALGSLSIAGTATLVPAAATGRVALDIGTITITAVGKGGTLTPITATSTLNLGAFLLSASGTSSSIQAPSVAFDDPFYANPPNLVFTTGTDAILGDYLGREYATNSGFTGSTTEWHQITSDDIITGSVSWPFSGAFADGTLYVRAYAARGGSPGSFSMQSPASTVVSRAVYDGVPSTWDFTDSTAVATSSLVTSNAVTPTGYTGPTQVLTNGNEVSINGGAFGIANTTLAPGQSIQVRHFSASTDGTAKVSTINVGGVDVTFQSTTAALGPIINANPVQPAEVTTSNVVTYTFTSQGLGTGTAVFCIGPLGGAVKVSSVSVVPTGGGSTVTCSRAARTSTGDSMEVWTSDTALSAGNYDITINYTGGSLTKHRIMHAAMTGQSSNTPTDTCMLNVSGTNVNPHKTADTLIVSTHGMGIVYCYDGTSTVANFSTMAGYTLLASRASGSNDYGMLRGTATGTPSFNSTTGFCGIIGASFA